MTLAPGDALELRVDALAAGGDGVARHAGRVVFVPRTAPGDLARVRVTGVRRNYARAELVELREPGPARREPPCPYFSRCGGCSWLHIDESEQHAARVAALREALRRIGGTEPPPLEYEPSPRALGYRARARVASDGRRVGFRERGTRRVVDVERCAVLTPETQAQLEELRRSRPGPGEYALRGFGDAVEVGGQRYRVGADAFFQANRSLWGRWLERVVEACGSGALLVELYAGVGFYTAALQKRFRRVVAVEGGSAAADARHNTRAEVVDAPVEVWAPRALAALRPEVVLVNPPRTGCHSSVIDALSASGAGRLVYVSCEPSTLARDVARLRDAYTPVRLVGLDAFPQTSHVEAIAVFERAISG